MSRAQGQLIGRLRAFHNETGAWPDFDQLMGAAGRKDRDAMTFQLFRLLILDLIEWTGEDGSPIIARQV